MPLAAEVFHLREVQLVVHYLQVQTRFLAAEAIVLDLFWKLLKIYVKNLRAKQIEEAFNLSNCLLIYCSVFVIFEA